MSALAIVFLGNTVLQWILAGVLALVVAIVLALLVRLARSRLGALASRSPGGLDDVVAGTLKATRRWFIVAATDAMPGPPGMITSG